MGSESQHPPSTRWKLVLVSHTHWDREWYRPFQLFRAMLVEAIESLLELMLSNPAYRYFTLDGQTIVLEDYLEARPDREQELRQLIAEGRILIGPWYVMPDEFLVSGEALIRNLLEGRRSASRFGPVMNVGYLPDTFGHIAQMPQILRGFGIDSAVLWRGIGSEVRHNEAIWKSPDGSTVLLERLPGGYDNAAVLPLEPAVLMKRLEHIRAQLQPGATTSYLLLMNGDDHMFPQPEIPAIIAEANRRLRDAEIVHGTLPMLLSWIREEAEAKGIQWQSIEGELRSSELSHLLAGVLSSRITIKQRNFHCQTLLERWAEPFSTLASLIPALAGRPAPPALKRLARDSPHLLRLAWRYLLMNQPHDSISGCSIDQVHREMETRYDWCEQVAEIVNLAALQCLADSVNTEPAPGEATLEGAVVVFNSEVGPRTDFATASVQLPKDVDRLALIAPDGRRVPYQLLGGRHAEIASLTLTRNQLTGYLRLAGPGRAWPRWKLRILEKTVKALLRGRMPELAVLDICVAPGADPATVNVDIETAAGKEHNYDAISASLRELSTLADRGDVQLFRIRVRRRDQLEIGFIAPQVPALGMRLFSFVPAEPARSRLPHMRMHEEVTLENEFLSVQVSPIDGTARLIHRESGAVYWNINALADSGDAGDEYSYSPPMNDQTIREPEEPPKITLVETGPARQMLRVEYALRIPAGLTDDRQGRSQQTVRCPVTMWLAVYPGVPRVDVRTVFTNHARDHRLRACFPTHLNTHVSHADGQFAVIQRPIQPRSEGEGWIEKPVTSNPQLIFVDLNDGKSGLMVANRGLPEFEIVPLEQGPCIAITLLRCVGWLSRDDLATRRGAAGPMVPTPGAQMLGNHTFEYSVIPHAGGLENAISQAYWFARPLRTRWTHSHPGPLAPEVSLLSATPSSVVISAVKPAEDNKAGIIVRVYNPLGSPVEVTLRTFFPLSAATLTNLAEDQDEEVPLQGPERLRFHLDRYQIATLRLIPAC